MIIVKKWFFHVVLCTYVTLVVCTGETPVVVEPLSGNFFGVLEDQEGNPLSEGTVYLVPQEYEPGVSAGSTCIDSVSSDQYGRYAFPMVKAGNYTMLAKAHGFASMRQSITVKEKEVVDLKKEILTSPGILSGKIQLQGHSDNSSAIVLLIGTNRYASVKDSSGFFDIPELASGSYLLRVLSLQPGFAKAETTVTVISGVHSSLPLIELKMRKIIMIGKLMIDYDPAMVTATLSWQTPDTADISGYTIYCNRAIRPDPVLTIDNNWDNVKIDVISFPDSMLKFSIATVDKNGTESPETSAEEIKKVSAIKLVKKIEHTPVNNELNSFRSYHIDQNGFIYEVFSNGVKKMDSNGIEIGSYFIPDSKRWSAILGSFSKIQTDENGNVYNLCYDIRDYTENLIKLDYQLKEAGKITGEIRECKELRFFTRNDGSIILLCNNSDSLDNCLYFGPDLKFIDERAVKNVPTIYSHYYTETGMSLNTGHLIEYYDYNFNYLSSIDPEEFLKDHIDTSLYQKRIDRIVNHVSPGNVYIAMIQGIWDYSLEKFVTQNKLLLFFNDKKQILARMAVENFYSYYTAFDYKGDFYMIKKGTNSENLIDVVYKYSMEEVYKNSK